LTDWEKTNIQIVYEELNKGFLSSTNVEDLFCSKSEKLLFSLNRRIEFIKPDIYFHKQEPVFDGTMFTDNLFPPQDSSLLYLNPNNEATKEITDEEISKLKNFSWKRVNELIGNEFVLYNKIELEDINQGAIGNCYFLSSLSAIAEFQERFEKIFVTKKRSENGCYLVRLILQGVPEIVVVDDYFPVENGRFACATSGKNEIWVQLLEKAYAKVNESYASTIAGLPGEALATLTEAPVVTYIHKRFANDQEHQLWEIIKFSDQKNYILCTNTGRHEETSKMGLVPCHAYTVISALEINGLKLLKIRNPWGQFEWKGDFSDKSPMWDTYPGLKEKVDFKNRNDGIFFMKFDDYLTFFPYTYICKYENGFKYHYKKVEQESRDSMISLKFFIDKPTNIYLSLHQKQQRFYSSMIKNYKVKLAKIILARYEKGSYIYVGSDSNDGEKLHIECNNLPVGEYHVFSNVYWPYDAPCRYVISTYAEKEVTLEALDCRKIPQNYLVQILNSFIQNSIQPKQVNELASYRVSLGDNKLGFSLLSFENSSQKDNLKVELIVESNNKITFLSKWLTLNRKVNKNQENIREEFCVIVQPKSKMILVWNLISHPYKVKLGFPNLSFQHIGDDNVLSTMQDQSQEIYSCLIDGYLSSLVKKSIHEEIYYTELEVSDGLLIIFSNQSSKDYTLRIDFPELKNLEFYGNRNFLFNLLNYNFYYLFLKRIKAGEKINFSFTLSIKKAQ
jgi:hypothetical protein